MTPTLVIADYIVIAAMLLVSSSIGIYFWFSGGKQKTTQEYFSADKSMSVVTVSIALMTSYLSAVSLLGVSSENYIYGTQYAVINIAYGLATPVVCYFYLPVFFNLNATSAFEYLERRFGKSTRLMASVAFLFQLLLYTGVVLYAPSLALEATTGISTTWSIIGIGLICTFYSTVGGIKAVLLTDVFQSLLMLVAVISVIVTAAINVGGFDEIWRIALNDSRIQFDNVSLDPTVRHTWWSLIIGGFFTYLSLYSVNQVQVQRMMTVKNLKSAQLATWLSWPMSSIMSLMTCAAGLAIYSKYRYCDPYESGRIASYDQLMPLYVMDTLSAYPGLPGLFIAGIFAAGLSTISATINSLSAIILEDYLKPLCKLLKKDLSTKESIVYSKTLAFIVGVACLGIAFLVSHLGGLLQAALTIFGVIGGPMLGVYSLGMFTKSANQTGAIIGTIVSIVFCLWIGFGQPKPPIPKLSVSTIGCNQTSFDSFNGTLNSFSNNNSDEKTYFYLYKLSYLWYCPIGFLISMIVGYVVSWVKILICKGEEDVELDANLFTPVLANAIQRKRTKEMENDNFEMHL